MIEILKAVALGIIEGITEFLPISSTGHLILANQFISFSESFTQKFDVIIQLGAILAVVLVYRNKLIPNRENPLKASISLWLKIIVAVIPALFIGALFHHQIETILFNPITVSIALVFWGIVLIVLESVQFKSRFNSIEAMGYGTALIIGFVQCLAMIPGTSRSAATIIGALVLGASRLVAVEFSFFLAIPTLVAASAYSMYKIGFDISSAELLVLAVGFVTSFLVAWGVIRFLLNYIAHRDFKLFGYYRIILGGIVLLYFLCLK